MKFSIYLNRRVFVTAQQRFWSDCANAQADLNLRWVHISEGTSSDLADQMHLLHNFVVRASYHIGRVNIFKPLPLRDRQADFDQISCPDFKRKRKWNFTVRYLRQSLLIQDKYGRKERTTEWMKEGTKKRTMDGWMNGRADGRTDGQMDGRTDGRMAGRTDGRMGGRTTGDGWMDRSINR